MRLNQLPQIDGLGDGPSICSTAGRTYHTTFSGTGNCNLCKVCSSFFGQLPSSNKNTHLKQIDSMMLVLYLEVGGYVWCIELGKASQSHNWNVGVAFPSVHVRGSPNRKCHTVCNANRLRISQRAYRNLWLKWQIEASVTNIIT